MMFELLPDFRASGPFMGEGVGRVRELIHKPCPVRLSRDARGYALIALRMMRRNVGASQTEAGAESPQMRDLLGGHLVRNDDDHPVALDRCHQSQAESRVARGSFHNQ